ncbi:hypothetical protein RUND412_003295 [Rhizina undulata]
MPIGNISALPSLRRQNLLVEFSSLRYAAPPGVYMSLSPNNGGGLWWGVMFVRKGPYKGAILKFTIHFPNMYPAVPPVVTFHTSVYHPLVHPQTQLAMKPGVFSLRHGFPHWFPYEGRLATPASPTSLALPSRTSLNSPKLSPSDRRAEKVDRKSAQREVTTVELLDYIKSTFDDEKVLDEIPLSAAENVLAWKSWIQGSGRRGGTGGWDEKVRIRFLDIDRDMAEVVKQNIFQNVSGEEEGGEEEEEEEEEEEDIL